MFNGIIEGFLKRDKLALSQAISFVERFPEKAYLLISALSEKTGRNLLDTSVHIIGITGSPGIGKSTIISQLIQHVDCGVLLCDPSSVKSEGAVLGDRIRMQGVREREGTFIRSVGTRGEVGGISLNTSDIVNLYIIFGMKRIIVETTGTGQGETEIYNIADTVILVVSPESGDEIQFMKGGILEIADIIVLNKSDRPSADKLYNEIKSSIDLSHTVYLNLMEGSPEEWKPPVIKAIAKDGVGIPELIELLEKHKKYIDEKGITLKKREKRMERDFVSALSRGFVKRIKETEDFKRNLSDILARKKDPYSAAIELLEKFVM